MSFPSALVCSLVASAVLLSGGCPQFNLNEAWVQGNRPLPSTDQLLMEAEEQMWLAGGMARFVLLDERFSRREASPPLAQEDCKAALAEAAMLLKQALGRDPKLHIASLYLAAVYLRAEDLPTAVAYAQAYRRAQPDDELGVIILSMAYLAGQNWDAVLELADQLIVEGGAEDEGYLAQYAAFACLHKKDLRKALEWATRAVDMDPEDPSGYYMLGAIQRLSGDEAGFAKTLAAAERLEPEAGAKIQAILDGLPPAKDFGDSHLSE
jgi:tetratricopeptide (TPR) repeat protein